jgi:hypothetical protein
VVTVSCFLLDFGSFFEEALLVVAVLGVADVDVDDDAEDVCEENISSMSADAIAFAFTL